MNQALQLTSIPKRVICLRVAVVTLVALVSASLIVSGTLLSQGFSKETWEEIFWPIFWLQTLVPILIAVPLGTYLQRDRVKLWRALQELERVHEELEVKSRVDGLTQVLNRESFLHETLDRLKTGISGAMLIIDIDHFKSINDTHGHLAGDKALKLISTAIQGAVRKHDILGRIGGEEFGVFVITDSPEFGIEAAERIRKAISQVEFHPSANTVQMITASIGVTMGSRQDMLKDILRRADASMYKAKDLGRNRVILNHAA